MESIDTSLNIVTKGVTKHIVGEDKKFPNLVADSVGYKYIDNTLGGYVNTVYIHAELKFSDKRRIGQSIRQIDLAIQILYRDNIVHILDHHNYGRNDGANKILLKRVIKRLNSEHNFVYNKYVKVLEQHNIIYLDGCYRISSK